MVGWGGEREEEKERNERAGIKRQCRIGRGDEEG